MKTNLLKCLAAVAASALLGPLACVAQDAPPPPLDSQDQPPTRGGFGGPRGDMVQLNPELRKLVDEYRAKPSDELKAKIKEEFSKAFDESLKRRAEMLERQKAEIEKLKANRDSEIATRLDKILSGKGGDAPRERRQKPQKD